MTGFTRTVRPLVVVAMPPPTPGVYERVNSFVKDHSCATNLIAYLLDEWRVGRAVARAERQARERFEEWRTTSVDPREEHVELLADSAEVVVLRHYLELLARDVAERGARLAVACIPGRSAYGEGLADAEAEPHQAARHRAALRTCASLDLPMLDLLPGLLEEKARQGEDERFTYRFDFHWNPNGHRAAALALEPFVRELVDGG